MPNLLRDGRNVRHASTRRQNFGNGGGDTVDRFRIHKYGAGSNATPEKVINTEKQTNLSNEELLALRDRDFNFSVVTEADWGTRIVLEVARDGFGWKAIGEFDRATGRVLPI